MNVYEKIASVMQKVQYLQKDGYVETGRGKGYKAMTDEKVASVLRPALLESRLVILPVNMESNRTDETVKTADNNGNTIERKNRVTDVHVVYRIVDIDNPSDFVDVESCGCGVDTQDKGVGKAMTYSRKYMLLNTFLIPTGNDTDDISSDMYDQSLYGKSEPSPLERPAKDAAIEAGLLRTQILTVAEGDLDRVNDYIKRYTNGMYTSMDDLNVDQLRTIKVNITKAKQNASK